MSHVTSQAQLWLQLDKNETTRAEIRALLDNNNVDELERRFGTRIEFGTAGLRAPMEAGFSRMNDLTVIQASQGLAAYICSTSSTCSVVIGHDHRHNSERFARLAAAAMIKRGIKVHFYDELVHTPLVPFGVKHLGATAGVMITASHNPAQDNGYKVYWANSCQIIPPHDTKIAAAIEENLRPECWDEQLVDTHPDLVEKPLKGVKAAYFAALNSVTSVGGPQNDFKFVYTPMHGVGLPAMAVAAESLGLAQSMIVVPEQARPDPEFPTVRFPNPEEAGALDLAISTAIAHDVSLVIASDPDADRFSAAERLPTGEWKILTGNELGILFAAHTFDVYREKLGKVDSLARLAMLCSTVSSQMLAVMAEKEGFHFEETLTGFKWLGNRALELSSQGFDALYAFEEAIGFMFAPVVHDKDGIAAASVFLTMARRWTADRVTAHQKLEELYKRFGYFESANSYFRSPDPNTTRKVFADIRALGKPYPEKVGGRKILRWRDLTEGFDSATASGKPTLPVSKSSEMITCELEGGVRFTVRGSGTEPKIKMYIECQADSKPAAKKGAFEVSEDLTKEWFRPAETGLGLP